ncbi:MAG: methionine--tRNA ligase [Rickettsiaceae bacterium H1]|nr:methionine--tRNA ligase [Rickettsiaceae bacterium H1]
MYITTPIYYVNDNPHIGHAYTNIVCDVIARFNRLNDKKVKFITGTDEHGQKIEKSAKKNNLTPREFANQVSKSFVKLTKLLNLTNDDFIRTSENRHKKSARLLWQKIKNNDYLYKGEYEGWYSIRDEAFYQEEEITNGKSPTGSTVEWVKESSYFFKLSRLQDKLIRWYNDNPDFIYPNSRYNEVVSFVKSGLKDISISRTTFSWGIEVPDDEEHIIYVWLDALANYLTGADFPDLTCKKYLDYWQSGDITHVIGKDILRFHAIYWPAFLMAADLPLPKKILTHGWWTNRGEKISKSLGNAIDPVALIKEFNVDYLRYFLMREIPFGQDGNFSKEIMIGRINSELANNIGNLVHRTLSMIHKNCNGEIPRNSTEVDAVLLETYALVEKYSIKMNNNKFNEAIECALNISSIGNEYIDKKAPWKLQKFDRSAMEKVLYNLLEMIRCIGILFQPFIPESANKILDQLNIKRNHRNIFHANVNYRLESGIKLPRVEMIFFRVE